MKEEFGLRSKVEMEENIKTVGLKDMHQMQVKALFDFIGLALDAAAETGNIKAINKIEYEADELVHLFGGCGVKVICE